MHFNINLPIITLFKKDNYTSTKIRVIIIHYNIDLNTTLILNYLILIIISDLNLLVPNLNY